MHMGSNFRRPDMMDVEEKVEGGTRKVGPDKIGNGISYESPDIS